MEDLAQKVYKDQNKKRKYFNKNINPYILISFGSLTFVYFFLYLSFFDKGFSFLFVSAVLLIISIIGIFKIDKKKEFGFGFGIAGAIIYLINIILFLCFSFLPIEDLKEENKIVEDFKKKCEENNGRFLEKYNECEFGLDENLCNSFGGEFSSCSSSCRNNPNKNVACTFNCVEVCKLN